MIVWAFPGLGKSELAKKHPEYEDADVRRFMFSGIEKGSELHGKTYDCTANEAFPQNYIEYVKQFENAPDRHVLINCSLPLCRNFENIVLVYPSRQIKETIRERMLKRGDQREFVEDMCRTFDDMVSALSHYPTVKRIVVSKDTYLTGLKGEIEDMYMTKQNMMDLIDSALELGVLKIENDILTDHSKKELFTDGFPLVKNSEEIAMALFEDEASMDMEALQAAVEEKEYELKVEKAKAERRQGYTREEMEDIIMDSMVAGVTRPHYGEVWPYTHGYEIKIQSVEPKFMPTGINGFFDLPRKVADMIENGKLTIDVKQLETETKNKMPSEEAMNYQPSSELPDWRLDSQWYRHIHSLKDVHDRKGLDAIANGRCQGTWSNCMACSQNDLIMQMVLFKGYCLDILLPENRPSECFRHEAFRTALVNYHAKHGLDISTNEKIKEWANAHPEAALNQSGYALKQVQRQIKTR